jgi:acetylornithine/N-succinyldiaminopimelate aminotransferase
MSDASTASATTASGEATAAWIERYEGSLLNLFGRPQLVLDHGDGAWVWDVDGRRYLDLVGGIAVNALGHNHPALVAAVSKQAGQLVHVSNFFTTVAQVELAEKLLHLAKAPEGSAVFFCNSGTEALEAAIKLARRTGRTDIVAAEGAFHGRTTGALALTHKPAYREPFEPLIPGVDARALRRRGGPAGGRRPADVGAWSSSPSRARAGSAPPTAPTCGSPAS